MFDSPLVWLLLLGIGCVTGTLSGVLGIGGGLLLVPTLTFLGVSVLQATATSLIGVFLSAVSGSLRNLSAKELNWQASLGLALPGMLTAQVGAWLGDRLPNSVLALGFSALALLTISLMNLRKRLLAQQDLILAPTPTPDMMPWIPVVGIGCIAGVLSGLFGVGGGVVMVPLQMLFLGESIKSAVRTSLGAIVAIAISGLAQHTWNGNVLWIPGLFLGIGGIMGAQFGTRLLPKLPDRWVNLLFRLLLLSLAVYMAIRGVWG